MSESVDRLRALQTEARQPGSDASVARQHDRGKGTARERLDTLLDPGTFSELDMFARHRATGFGIDKTRPLTDGVVAGWGRIDGRQVLVFSQDFTVFGGALGEVFAAKMRKAMDLAIATQVPIIGLNDGAGARIQEGVAALDAYSQIFRQNVAASGVIPQISVMLGPCAGGAVYSPAMTDFVLMVDGTSHMFITGPDVVKTVTGEEVSQEQLGGATTHSYKSGVASFVYDNEEQCLAAARRLLTFLPQNNSEPVPLVQSSDPPDRDCDLSGVPERPGDPYDVRSIISSVVDDGDFMESQENFAPNIVCGLARMGGQAVGIVANQPAVLGGALDIDSCEKAARFVRTCDAFGLPVVTLVDVPGFLPGLDQERGAIIRHGAKLLFAYCEATVPTVQVVTRQAYGGAYVVMGSRSTGADITLAWPGAEIAVMSAQSAVRVLHHRDIELAGDPQSLKDQLVQSYRDTHAHPYAAAERGYIDDVIEPSHTRRRIINALDMLKTKKSSSPHRKHANVPL